MIKYTDRQLKLIGEIILNHLARFEHGTSSVSRVTKAIRDAGYRIGYPESLITDAGFTIEMVSKKTGELVPYGIHGSYYYRVSL